jgi:AmiR/NasT family two-component response regulator
MSVQEQSDVIQVRVIDRGRMEQQLESAVAPLLQRALLERDRGILVTRHSPMDFTVQLHPSVPFGVTLEKREW